MTALVPDQAPAPQTPTTARQVAVRKLLVTHLVSIMGGEQFLRLVPALVGALTPHLAPDPASRVERFQLAGGRLTTSPTPGAPTTDDIPVPLTERELQVLRGVSQGLGNRAVGEQLRLTQDTIKTHMRHILRKLAARDRAHAVTRGHETGLLP